MTTQYRPPVMDRVIGVPVTVERHDTVPAADLRYDDWNSFQSVEDPGEWGMDNPDGSALRFFDSLTKFSEATQLALTLTDADGLELGDPTPPFPLTMTWSDGRSLAYTVTASERYLYGGFRFVGRTFTLSALVLTGNGTAAPAGDVTVRAGTGSTTTVSEQIERRSRGACAPASSPTADATGAWARPVVQVVAVVHRAANIVESGRQASQGPHEQRDHQG